jgi:hypothetical protein
MIYHIGGNLTKTDIFIAVLFMITIAVIIGLNIVNVIDKKINNVSVNVPEPKLILNISKDDEDKISICACDKQKVVNKEENVVGEEQIEKFTNVSDAQDTNNYKQIKEEILSDPNNNKFTDDDILTDADFGHDSNYAPNRYVACANSSIGGRYKGGKKRIYPYRINCNNPNKLTAENYYKTFYNKFVIPIEDYNIKGFNYLNYTSYPTPRQVNNLKILSKNAKGVPNNKKYIPEGYNYAFFNTPALPMP